MKSIAQVSEKILIDDKTTNQKTYFDDNSVETNTNTNTQTDIRKEINSNILTHEIIRQKTEFINKSIEEILFHNSMKRNIALNALNAILTYLCEILNNNSNNNNTNNNTNNNNNNSNNLEYMIDTSDILFQEDMINIVGIHNLLFHLGFEASKLTSTSTSTSITDSMMNSTSMNVSTLTYESYIDCNIYENQYNNNNDNNIYTNYNYILKNNIKYDYIYYCYHLIHQLLINELRADPQTIPQLITNTVNSNSSNIDNNTHNLNNNNKRNQSNIVSIFISLIQIIYLSVCQCVSVSFKQYLQYYYLNLFKL